MFREVNHRIRDVSGGWTDESVGFLCECDDPACTETVLLSTAVYDELLRNGHSVLVEGHESSSLLVA